MIIHDLANKEFETKDDIVVEIADAILEVDAMATELNTIKETNVSLENEVNALKTKNLELLAMIPVVVSQSTENNEIDDVINEEDIYF